MVGNRVTTMQVLLLLGVVVPCAGHLSAICTATSPQQPNSFAWWFMTYDHSPNVVKAPGKVFIRDPAARVIEAEFSNFCKPTGIPLVRSQGSTTTDFENMLKAGCLGLSDPQGRVPIFTDSTVECYEADNNNPLPDYALGVRGNNVFVAPYNSIMTDLYFVVVEGTPLQDLVSGSYVTWFTGTDQNMDPCPSAHPCSLARKPWTFEISVSSGGARCLDAPPPLANTVPASLSGCDGSTSRIEAGELCHVQCQPGYAKIGVLQCKDNGDGTASWAADNFKCTNNVVCKLPSAAENNNHHISGDIRGVLAPCTTLTPADTSCQYTCNGFNNQVSVGKIECKNENGNGVWKPVGMSGYDGCAWTQAPPPTPAPTPAPCTDGVKVQVDGGSEIGGTPLDGEQDFNAFGVILSLIPQSLRQMRVHVAPNLPLPKGSVIDLACCGKEVCEFVVSHYHCPPCSSPVNGGFPGILPVSGFESASCAPKYGATEQKMVSYKMALQPGQTTTLPELTAEATSFVIFSQTGTVFSDDWCPAKLNKGCGGPCPITSCTCVKTL